MLASPPVRAAGERVGGLWAALGAAAICFCALFFGGGLVGRLVTRERLAESAALLIGCVAAWALLAKCVPALYSDYGRLARLRAPVDYWNELALLCDVGVPIALWLAVARR